MTVRNTQRQPNPAETRTPRVAPARPGRPTRRQAGFALRARVLVTRGRLDRQLVAGDPHGSDAALGMRARQLVDPRTRRRLAGNLRGVVEYVEAADREGRPGFSAVMIERAPVRAGSAALLGLAARLDGPQPVAARGVVLARRLLTDPSGSPLFNLDCDRTVAQAAWEVADALRCDDPPVTGLRSLAQRDPGPRIHRPA